MGWPSINPSYFDVNYRGTIGFDTLPYHHDKPRFFLGGTHGDPKNSDAGGQLRHEDGAGWKLLQSPGRMHQELGAGSVKLSWHGRSKHVIVTGLV